MEVSINMFFLIVTALGLVGSTFSWGMYRTGFSLLHSAWTLLPFLLMPLIFAIGNIFTESLPVTLIRYFSWSGGVWMGFIFEMYPLYWTPSKEGTFCVIRLNLS